MKNLKMSVRLAARIFITIGVAILSYAGDWIQIGGPASGIYVGEKGLYATCPQTGDLMRYEGTPFKWSRAGGPGAGWAANRDNLYGIARDYESIFQYIADDQPWKPIGSPYKKLIAGGKELFAIHKDTNQICRYKENAPNWPNVGVADEADCFAVNDIALYRLVVSKNDVQQYTLVGDPSLVGKWMSIGKPENRTARWLIAGGKELYATVGEGDIFRYTGSPGTWKPAGGPGHTFAINEIGLYGLSPDQKSVWQYTGKGMEWIMIATPPSGQNIIPFIWARGKDLYTSKPGESEFGIGAIYQYVGELKDLKMIEMKK